MNSSFKESGDFQAIAQWFRKHPYPHCKNVNNLSTLRSGIAIAEVLSDKLPPSYQALFLPNIEIYNLNPQRAMLNLKIILNALGQFFTNNNADDINIEEFTAEGLYFDHNMMETFLFTVIMPLKKSNKQMSIPEKRTQVHYVEELSQIANLSSIIANYEPKVHAQNVVREQGEERQVYQVEQLDEQQVRISKICDYLQEQHHIIVQNASPQQILGKLVNSTFTGSRLDKELVIKQSQYELGSAFVFKKIGDYLLGCQRMPKHNVLAMLEEVQSGCMRQELFWNIIEDIMNIKASHLKKLRKSSTKKSIEKIKSTKQLVPSNKQNIESYVRSAIPKEHQKFKKARYEPYECSPQVVRICELWIGSELGYEHSLNKSKKAKNRQDNPLLNGVLLGSIVMRMQLGKVSINKEPTSAEAITKNMNEVVNCILRRSIEAGRKFSKVKPSYQAFLGIIWEVRQQFENKATLEKARRASVDREKQCLKTIQINKKAIINWLQSRGFQFEDEEQPADAVSQICGQILELRLLRQTTKKIRENNMSKVVTQLRRLGWEGAVQGRGALGQQHERIRWSMLDFVHGLCQNKIYYAQ